MTKPPPVKYVLPISLKSFYTGKNITIIGRKDGLCHKCKGTGAMSK